MTITSTIASQAPARVDLAGGTLDIWPLYLFHENSQTVNFAIECFARSQVTPRREAAIDLISSDLNRRERFPSLAALKKAKKWKLPLLARLVLAFGPRGGFTLETGSDVPAGSGLGGSSALNIAICGALTRFTKTKISPVKMIELARNVEAQVLGVPTGEQDYYSAMFGGMQAIRLTPRGIQPERLGVSVGELDSRIVLCYTGESRNSGINNWEVQKAHLDGNRAVVRHFRGIAAIAAEMRAALLERDWRSVSGLLRREWEARKKNHPGITTPTIERLIAIASRSGASAAKACGAGGGGCVVFLVEPEARSAVAAALARGGARILPAKPASRGLQVHS